MYNSPNKSKDLGGIEQVVLVFNKSNSLTSVTHKYLNLFVQLIVMNVSNFKI
jgi:hypothetical protein